LSSNGTLANWTYELSTGEVWILPTQTIYLFDTVSEMTEWLAANGLVIEATTPPPLEES